MFELEFERTVGERGGKRTRIFTPPPPSLSLFLTFLSLPNHPLPSKPKMAATIFVKKILARQNYACSQARVGGGGGWTDTITNLFAVFPSVN